MGSPSGIRVSAVSPGIVNTPLPPPEAHEFLAALHPFGSIGEIADDELLSTRELLAAGVLSGYARVVFARPEGDVPVYPTVIAQRGQSGWASSHHHVSAAAS